MATCSSVVGVRPVCGRQSGHLGLDGGAGCRANPGGASGLHGGVHGGNLRQKLRQGAGDGRIHFGAGDGAAARGRGAAAGQAVFCCWVVTTSVHADGGGGRTGGLPPWV